MSYLIFLAILLFAAIATALLRLFGFGLTFEAVFKALATGVVFLPMVLMSALIVLIVEVGLCMVIFFTLDLTGLVRLANIPHRYEVFAIWGLVASAIGIVVISIILNFMRHRRIVKGER